jgi:predicted O-methyltransferase YrrM
MNTLARLIKNPWDEYALCLLFKRRRMRLPTVALNAWFPEADDVPVSITAVPKGPRSSPIRDVIFLLKLVRLLKPKQILEIGSYRGYVARAIAEHMPEDARLVALDIDARHGEAYRGTPLAERIERRVGKFAGGCFTEGEAHSYDLIFLDADHAFEAVKHDTEVTLPLLSPTGVLVWHDYANWGGFTGACGVPEYLAELAEHLPVAHLAGTGMALYSPAWKDSQRAAFEEMLRTTERWEQAEHWESCIPPAT